MQAKTGTHPSSVLRLASVIAWNSIVARNERSLLGVAWYLLNPILLFLVMYGIHIKMPLAPLSNYALYLATGLLCYSVFRGVTSSISYSFVAAAALIRSVTVPKLALCIGRMIEALFVHAIEILVLFVVAAWFGIWVNVFAYLIPFLIFLIFAFSVGYVLAVIAVYINDMQNIWNFLMMALIFLSPIFYFMPVSERPWFVAYNPLTVFVDTARSALIEGTILWQNIGIVLAVSVISLGVAYAVHQSRYAQDIAENI